MFSPEVAQKLLAAALQSARHLGRDGDTDIVHVNEHEKAMLKALGGRGSVNPVTGLREYPPKGAPHETAAGTRTGRPDAGGKAGNNSGKSGTSASGTMSQVAAEREIAQAAAASRTADFQNEDNSFLDNIGNAILGALGINEIDPTASNAEALRTGKMPSKKADWGFDPAGGIGAAFGGPLGSIVARTVSKALGHPLEINLGDFSLDGSRTAGARNKAGKGEQNDERMRGFSDVLAAVTSPPSQPEDLATQPQKPNLLNPDVPLITLLLSRFNTTAANNPAPYTINEAKHSKISSDALENYYRIK